MDFWTKHENAWWANAGAKGSSRGGKHRGSPAGAPSSQDVTVGVCAYCGLHGDDVLLGICAGCVEE